MKMRYSTKFSSPIIIFNIEMKMNENRVYFYSNYQLNNIILLFFLW